MVSIIIINYNVSDLLINCINSIKKQITIPHEIIIVDNASSHIEVEKLKTVQNSNKIILNSVNIGFGKAVNCGVEHARGEHFLILNPDTLFIDNSLEHAVELINKDDNLGLISPKVFNKNNCFEPTAKRFPTFTFFIYQIFYLGKLPFKNRIMHKYYYNYADFAKEQVVDDVVGCAILMKKDVFNKIGKYNEKYFMYFEDTDLCMKLKKINKIVLYCPQFKIVHIHGQSSIQNNTRQYEYYKSMIKYSEDHLTRYQTNILKLLMLLTQGVLPLLLFVKYCVRADFKKFSSKSKIAFNLCLWLLWKKNN